MTPLTPLPELTAHKKKLLPWMTIHKTKKESEPRELLPLIAGHLFYERLFPVNNLIMGERKHEVLIEGVPDAEGDLVLMILSKNRIDRKTAKGRVKNRTTVAFLLWGEAKTFFRFLVQEKMIPKDPIRNLELPKSILKLPDVISVEEIERLLDAPNSKTPRGVRDAAMIEPVRGRDGRPAAGPAPGERDAAQAATSLAGDVVRLPVALLEPLDPAGAIHQLLLAREERVAVGTDFDVDLRKCRPGLERVPARTLHYRAPIIRMYTRFHCSSPLQKVHTSAAR